MEVVKTIKQTRTMVADAKKAGKKVALVPTMGNLHDGHLALIDEAKKHADFIVCSSFVNPTQFGPKEGFDKYPRTGLQDQQKLTFKSVAILFSPPEYEIYPFGRNQTTVEVPHITKTLCGAARPGHFSGVTTVVSKLFNIIQPDFAIFGEKDFQQLVVIKKMVRELFYPIDILSIPTVREADGLALSSRNSFLNTADRTLAPQLYATLSSVKYKMLAGDREFTKLAEEALKRLSDKGFTTDYFEIRDAETLERPSEGSTHLVLLGAVTLGNTRLIDNISLTLKS